MNSIIEDGQTDTPIDIQNQPTSPIDVPGEENPFSQIRKKELVKNREFNLKQ
jgi:hypothetical protein